MLKDYHYFINHLKVRFVFNLDLISRMENGVIDGCMWVVRKIKNFFMAIFNFIVENIFFMGQKKLKTKYKAIKAIITLSIIVLAVSFYPLIRKGLKNY